MIRPRRSVLYMPASNPRAIEKARGLDCDAIILDLEDAVAPDAKPAARDAAVAAVRGGGFGHREVAIRVNGTGTAWHADDVAAAAAARPDAIVVPKVDDAAAAAAAVAQAAGTPVWAMIESPRAVLGVEGIAATDGVAALVAGTADLAREIGATPGRDRAEFAYALQRMLLAARAWDRLAFDGIHSDIADAQGLEASAAQGAAMGFDGKTLVHPSQIDAANRAFSPSPDAIEQARGLIAAHEAATAAGQGVTTYRGRMVEALHVAVARRTLAFADALAARG